MRLPLIILYEKGNTEKEGCLHWLPVGFRAPAANGDAADTTS
jgi:hypothetical protein